MGTKERGSDGERERRRNAPVRFAWRIVREMNLAGVAKGRRDEGTKEREGETKECPCKVCVADCA